MGSTTADFRPSAVRALRNLMMGVIERWKLKDQVEFLEKLHIKFQNIYPRRYPLARLRSPYLQKNCKEGAWTNRWLHNFEEVYNAAAYIGELKKSVKCNYCGKVVSGFHRLKCHLGAVGKDVTHRSKFPVDVKEVFEAVLLEKKMKRSLSPLKGNVNSNKADTQAVIYLKGTVC